MPECCSESLDFIKTFGWNLEMFEVLTKVKITCQEIILNVSNDKITL